MVGGSGELYLTGNGTTFVSRGAVYERLDGGGQPVTFDVGLYDAAAADAALEAAHQIRGAVPGLRAAPALLDLRTGDVSRPDGARPPSD